MADSYVCSGATMKCTMGTSTARLTVLPIRTVFLTGQPMANISDHLTMVNLAPFGRCRSLGFPATAAATAAHHGHLTPMPCMHNTPFPWMNGKNDYIVKGDPALLKSSTCQCMWGGTISLITDGQTPTGPADMSQKPREEFDKNQRKKNAEQIQKRQQAIADTLSKTVNKPEEALQSTKAQKGPNPIQSPAVNNAAKTKQAIKLQQLAENKEEKQIDKLMLKDAYWKMEGNKIKILPFQTKQAGFYLELYLEHEDNPAYTPEGAEITISFPPIEGTLFEGEDITINYGALSSAGKKEKVDGKARTIYTLSNPSLLPDLPFFD